MPRPGGSVAGANDGNRSAGKRFTGSFSPPPHRVKKTETSGVVIYDVYSRVTGKVAYRHNVASGARFDRVAVGPLDMMFNNGAPIWYLHLDHLGSPVAKTTPSGAVRLTAFTPQTVQPHPGASTTPPSASA
ncbi:MAG: hypothetical protein AAGD92_05895 [Pseudomonadota bacterium]